MGRFWVEDNFIREHAKHLTPETVVVFFYLCSRADSKGIVSVGVRRISEDLGISKNTAYKSIESLTASHHVGHKGKGAHGVSILEVYSVPPRGTVGNPASHLESSSVPFDVKIASHHVGQKEVSTKEVLRKGNFSTVPAEGHRGTEGSEKWKKLRTALTTKP